LWIICWRALPQGAVASGDGVPPQQVPERVGYSANPQYFVHLFSKATGMTPREYAQALRIEP
jgi:AraC-like DNA-binding protein